MKILRLNICCAGLVSLTACVKEPPPISVAEFMDNSRTLEAAMVRCNRNRSELKYTAECMNARDAIDRLEVRDKQARHADLEAQSERKRQALRQTQEAAAQARRRALEAEKRQEEAEYLDAFDTLLPDGTGLTSDPAAELGNVGEPVYDESRNAPAPLETGSSAGAKEAALTDSAIEGDIESIREELQRRQQEPR